MRLFSVFRFHLSCQIFLDCTFNINGMMFKYYSKKREAVPELAPMLWHSFGTIAALLQEIINIYPAIHPPNLTVSNLEVFIW